MQVTEISEVNHMIAMMRMAACMSPTFHDRHDSEVDRVYNSSPKMEMQLRDSWIDRVVSMKAPMPAKKKQPTPLKNGLSLGTFAGNRFIGSRAVTDRLNAIARSVGAGRRSGFSKASEKSTGDNRGKEATSDTRAPENASASVSDKASAFVGLTFAKEKIEPLPSTRTTSLLGQLLSGAGTSVGAKPAVLKVDGGVVLRLTIYLPSQKEMKIDLYDVSTVEDAIKELLRLHQAEGQQPHLYYGHPECYELRLHDCDGLPDEDFPALDRFRKIKQFGDGVDHEYCLCERPETCPPADDTSDSYVSQPLSKTESIVSNLKVNGANNKTFLKIHMPKGEDYTVVAVDYKTTGQDLLPALCRRHRLQLFQDQYVLKISEADRARLELPSDEIDLFTKLRPLNVHEATLTTKHYVDAAKVPVMIAPTVDEPVAYSNRSRPPPGTFMFNDMTAGMFKEWQVEKKNKYGTWQHRMLGIDLNKIYNSKVGIHSRNTTKIPERAISCIEWVRFLQDPSGFQIYFKDHIEEIITDYKADSAFECAEIVAKLKYILARRQQQLRA